MEWRQEDRDKKNAEERKKNTNEDRKIRIRK